MQSSINSICRKPHLTHIITTHLSPQHNPHVNKHLLRKFKETVILTSGIFFIVSSLSVLSSEYHSILTPSCPLTFLPCPLTEPPHLTDDFFENVFHGFFLCLFSEFPSPTTESHYKNYCKIVILLYLKNNCLFMIFNNELIKTIDSSFNVTHQGTLPD